ncbi:MAG: hypothetical protein QM528_07060 [Phycisphaerales bacterium]|nr:hypothetical protein [Phycisphaerales bacterium]
MEVKQLTLTDTINLEAKTRKKTKTQKRLDTITQLWKVSTAFID